MCNFMTVADQAGLSLTWSQIPEGTFSHDVVHVHFIRELEHVNINAPVSCNPSPQPMGMGGG